jgi:hypothetical protein
VGSPVKDCRVGLALVAALCALLAAPGVASARFSQKKAIWGPVRVDGVSQFPIYKDLGASIFMEKIDWNRVAPTRPARPTDPSDRAYSWPPELDDAIAQAGQNGMRVSIVISGSPAWASGHNDPRWAPRKPADFARFATAASRRYPSVHLWQIWGEPTRRFNFMPLDHERRGRPLDKKMQKGPHLYARILDAAYGALKAQSRRNLVIGGNSFTTGDISPYNWVKNLRLPNGLPPRMDLYGHNPFSNRRPLFGRPPLGFGFADFSDLPRLSRSIDRYLARPRHKRQLKLYLSELFWPTDHENFEFNFWVTQSAAALWLSDALRETERWSQIYTLAWFSLYDDPPRPQGNEVNRGLLTWDGKKKPAYNAFKNG